MLNALLLYVEIVNKTLSRGYNYLILLAILTIFFCFWKLGSAPLNEWDESRNGVNAIEMLQNGDYVNLYYGGEPDTWNAKPPLMIWLIAASYKVFGFNEFALRFPAALAAFISLIVLFQLLVLYTSRLSAFLTCLILMTVDGIIGKHVGRTGDFDALLLMFLLLAIYQFLLYFDFNKRNGIIFSAVFMGMAFYTKGLAALFIAPGLLIYTLSTKRLKAILTDYKFWISVFIFLCFVASWYLIITNYGLKFTSSKYGSENSFQTMWKYDILERLTSGYNSTTAKQNYAFLLGYLDVKFNVWNYVFYLGILYWLYRRYWVSEKNGNISLSRKLVILSFCLILSMGLVLSLSAEAYFWYMTPALPFIAFVTVAGIKNTITGYRALAVVYILIFGFTFGRKAVELNNPKQYPEFLLSASASLSNAPKVSLYAMGRQDYLLYSLFKNQNVEVREELNDFSFIADEVIMVNRQFYEQSILLRNKTKLISSNDSYCICEVTL